MLQVGTIIYLMITDNIHTLLHLEISACTAHTWYKGKIEEYIISEGYIHIIQPIYIRIQIGTHQGFCLQLMFYVVHRKKRGYSAFIAYKGK